MKYSKHSCQIDKLYSFDLYQDAYGKCKYFNQRPWDVAMSRNLKKEYDYFKSKFIQDVVNGVRDTNEYYVLLKIALDGPIIYFNLEY